MIILAINIDKPDFVMSDLCRGCISNRVKNLIFWSIQKATCNLSRYGREKELVTEELFQAVYNVISNQYWVGGSLVDLRLLISEHQSYDKK